MTIDWEHFTLWQSLLGGGLVGISTSLLLLICGKIAGISGICGGLLQPSLGDKQWRLVFLLGLIIAPISYRFFSQSPTIIIEANWPVTLLAGFFVGFGTRLSGGCTSGHGVCGLSRFSLRSLVATLIFIGFGFLTVWLIRHVLSH